MALQVCDLALSSCRLMCQDRFLVMGSLDNSIYLYSVDSGRLVSTVQAHDDAVSCIGCAAFGDAKIAKLITGSWCGDVKVFLRQQPSFSFFVIAYDEFIYLDLAN